MRRLYRFLLDVLQTLVCLILIGIFRCFSFEKASNRAGFLGRGLGRLLKGLRKRARKNLNRAMPELSLQKQHEIIEGMFDNLARTVMEYTALPKLEIYGPQSRVEVVGLEIIDQLRDDQKPAVLFLGHLANWEIGTMAGIQRGLKITQVYRRLNYPLLDKLIHRVHRWVAQEVISKGKEGSRQILQALRKNQHVSMLNDQKLTEGKWVPFFGIPAKTAATGARMALKYDFPFVPVRVERIEKTKFRVTYYPPLKSSRKTPDAQLTDLLTQMNQLLESWIRDRPEQWLWLHNRWPKGYQKK